MFLQLKSSEEINALIAGATYAALSTPTKTQLANHFILMPASVRAAALSIEVASLTPLEAAFCQALFEDTDAPPTTLPPTAAFTMSVSNGTAPLTVVFTETSLGAITSRAWSFGDGDSSALQNPLHTFSSTGNFTVTLTVSGPGGTSSATHTVHVGVATGGVGSISFVCSSPGMLVQGDVIGFFRPLVPVSLLDMSAQLSKPGASMKVGIIDEDGESMGEDGELVIPAATKFARRDGQLVLNANTVYGVKLLAYPADGTNGGGGGGGGNDGGSLTAAFSWSQYNQGLSFNADQSTALPGDPIVEYHFEFGDGTSGVPDEYHFYDTDGSWNVTLTVTTQSGATASVTHTVTITTPTQPHFRGLVQNGGTSSTLPAEGLIATILCTPI